MDELVEEFTAKSLLPSGEAMALAEARAIEHEESERAAELVKRKQSLVAMGVPVKDIDLVVLAVMRDTEALIAARRHAETGGPIVLSGLRGCGKTTAAAWWLAQPGPRSAYLELGAPMFYSITRLQRVSRFKAEEMEPIERARRLVIDDLGSEYVDVKGSLAALLDGIINERYANLLPTLITTNLHGTEFKSSYGERIARRIREKGEFVSIKESLQP